MGLIYSKAFLFTAIFTMCLLSVCPNEARAQISNKPFSFKNSGDGLGMSLGGRQAILNDKILSSRPDNLLRGPGGVLFDVQEGPGKSAIVSVSGTQEFIPQYRGTSFKDSNSYMSAGVFNSFFAPSEIKSAFASYAQKLSGATINLWTVRVASGGMFISYGNNNSTVDAWTGQVFAMDPVAN